MGEKLLRLIHDLTNYHERAAFRERIPCEEVSRGSREEKLFPPIPPPPQPGRPGDQRKGTRKGACQAPTTAMAALRQAPFLGA